MFRFRRIFDNSIERQLLMLRLRGLLVLPLCRLSLQGGLLLES